MSDKATRLKDTYGRAQHRELAEQIAKLAGLNGREGMVSDADNRIDPLELAAQRGVRELGWQLLRAIGWDMELKPPVRPARKARERAASEQGGEDAASE